MDHTCTDQGLVWECADVLTAPLLGLACAGPSVNHLSMALQIDEQDTLDRSVEEGAPGEAAALCLEGSSRGAEVRCKPLSVL